VFISHSSKDKEISQKLFNWLSDQGLSVWLDQYELYPGIDLKKTLLENIIDVDYVILIISENSLKSKWVDYETDQTLEEEKKRTRVKLIPVVIGDLEVPLKIDHKKYLRIDSFDKNKIDDILLTIFQDYYILKLFLDKNFEFDTDKTTESIKIFYKLRPEKPVLVRIYHQRFTKRICDSFKKLVKRSKVHDIGEKKILYIGVDSLELDLHNFWHAFSVILSFLINDLTRQFNKDLTILMNTLVKIFDYILFYLYSLTKYVTGAKGQESFYYESFRNIGDSGLYKYKAKFHSYENYYPVHGTINQYLRYMLRNEISDFKEWHRIALVPHESFQGATVTTYIYGLIPLLEYSVAGEIPTLSWYYYCVPQIIQSYILGLIIDHISINDYGYQIGLNMKNYKYLGIA
jgi:hypothetical protein